MKLFRMPTRDANDADYLAIMMLLGGFYFSYQGLFHDVGVNSQVIIGLICLVFCCPLWLRVPHAKWGGVLVALVMFYTPVTNLMTKGFSSNSVVLMVLLVWVTWWMASIDYSHRFEEENDDSSGEDILEPDEEVVDFVGFYIDQIHELDWPDGESEYVEFFHNLPPKCKTLWATWIYQMEVDNGGHSQFFFNMIDPCYKVECEKGLKELGAMKQLALLEESESLLDGIRDDLHEAKNWNEWIEVLDKYQLRKKLWALDSKFYKEKADFYELRKKYIEKNMKDFSLLGSPESFGD